MVDRNRGASPAASGLLQVRLPLIAVKPATARQPCESLAQNLDAGRWLVASSDDHAKARKASPPCGHARIAGTLQRASQDDASTWPCHSNPEEQSMTTDTTPGNERATNETQWSQAKPSVCS